MRALKKLPLVASLVTLTLYSCTTPNLIPNQQNTGNQTNTIVSNVNDLKFTKVSSDKLAQYNQVLTQNMSGQQTNKAELASPNAPMAVPSAAAVSSAMAPMPSFAAGVSSDMARSAMPISYFPYPGAFEEYAVIDFEEAKLDGFSGTYLEALMKIVKPAIKGLASDARLVNTSGNTDNTGAIKMNQNTDPNSPYYYPQFQWYFTFASASKKEVYSINISSKETLILRQKWGLKELSYDSIKIDSSEAIKIITKAILDKNFTSPDGVPYMAPNSEVLTEIPQDSTWYFYLESDGKGKLIWNINLNINNPNPYPPYPMPMYDSVAGTSSAGSAPSTTSTTVPTASPSAAASAIPTSMPTFKPQVRTYYYYSGGYARLEADTGKILSITKPTKTKVEDYYYPEYYQKMYPSAVPVPMATATAIP